MKPTKQEDRLRRAQRQKTDEANAIRADAVEKERRQKMRAAGRHRRQQKRAD